MVSRRSSRTTRQPLATLGNLALAQQCVYVASESFVAKTEHRYEGRLAADLRSCPLHLFSFCPTAFELLVFRYESFGAGIDVGRICMHSDRDMQIGMHA